MMHAKNCRLLLGCFMLVSVADAQQSGSISGIVTDASGAPSSGAMVLNNSVPPLQRDSSGRIVWSGPLVSSGVRTGADGTFTLSSLPDGEYLVCAHGAKPNQLATCEWGAPPLRINIAGGAAVNNVKLRLSTGTVLVFGVSDPNGVVQDLSSAAQPNGLIPLSGGNFRIGVMLGTYYARAEFSSQAGIVRNYTVTVPSNVTLRLFADTQLSLSDQSGNTIPAGALSTAIAVGAAATQNVVLQVK